MKLKDSWVFVGVLILFGMAVSDWIVPQKSSVDKTVEALKNCGVITKKLNQALSESQSVDFLSELDKGKAK